MEEVAIHMRIPSSCAYLPLQKTQRTGMQTVSHEHTVPWKTVTALIGNARHLRLQSSVSSLIIHELQLSSVL